MHTELPHALRLPATAALPTTSPRPFPVALPVALLVALPVALLVALCAALLAPLPAQAQAQHVDVCALVACSASGVRSAALTAPAGAWPAMRPSSTPSSPMLASTAPDRATPAAPAASATSAAAASPVPARDPWARRIQGRETEGEDACLLNFGFGGQLARKGTLETHVLGRTQAWRGPAR